MMAQRDILVVGAGIIGLWQALMLARAGHRVKLIEQSATPFANGASQYAGVMLSPDCEAESAPDIVRSFGQEGLAMWRAAYPNLVNAGSLVVASPRDRAELTRYSRLTANHEALREVAIGQLEPDLAGRFPDALYFANEAHMAAPDALAFLLDAARSAGVEIILGQAWRPTALSASSSRPGPRLRREGPAASISMQENLTSSSGDTTSSRRPDVGPGRRRDDGGECDLTIDCRGLAARGELPALRGVRGERVLVRAQDVTLNRPIRLLHPRHPLYVVPWSEGRYIIGATMIESEDAGPMTVRSALELLGAAYALHPAFGEAGILEMGAGVRPAFPDNVPRAIICDGGRHILVNGAFRHGFLLAPVLAKAVANYLSKRAPHALLTLE